MGNNTILGNNAILGNDNAILENDNAILGNIILKNYKAIFTFLDQHFKWIFSTITVKYKIITVRLKNC